MNGSKAILPPQFAGYRLLAAELAKVPLERLPQVDAMASIFVSGLEAAAQMDRVLQSSAAVRPGV